MDTIQVNPRLDLVFERTTALAPEKIWKGWTDPATLMKWFCPKPWKVTECRIDLKPGGEFYTLMEGPKGEKMPNEGCFLEVIPREKLVWTNMMTKGFRPATVEVIGFPFTGTILVSKIGQETLYKAIITHADEKGRNQHDQMGFQEGWGKAFEQLEEL